MIKFLDKIVNWLDAKDYNNGEGGHYLIAMGRWGLFLIFMFMNILLIILMAR